MIYLKFDGASASITAAAGLNYFGTDGADVMNGTAVDEAFWGGGGDVMTGGAGHDTYYLKSASDVVVEQAGGGVDRIVAWTSINLADHSQIENLTVGGDGTYGAGNALDNVVEGQAGVQQLYGGAGQDVLVGGAGGDVFIVVKGEGNDVIQDFAFGQDKVRLKAGLTTFDQIQARLSQAGQDVKLDLGGGDALVFRNATVGQFSAADFQLELNAASLGAKTFSDEFSGALSLWDRESNPTGTWRPDYGYQAEQGVGSYTLVSNDEKQIYTSPYFRGHDGDFAESPFVSNADGTLSIWARPSDNGKLFGHSYTSGLITTKESFSQTYGYFEMRASLPDAAGAWPAFWMLPADGSWPPELDIMETLTHDPNGLWTTQHSGLGGHKAQGQLSFVPDTTDGFHTYGAMWGESEIVWYVDNVEIFRSATPADMHKPMFLLANLALGGWGGAIDPASLPAEFRIDYIRAYALEQTPAPAPTPAPVPAPAPAPVPGPASAFLAPAFANILREGEPGAAARAFLDHTTLALDVGVTSRGAALSSLLKFADTTTSVATMAYQFFTGAIPSAEGLDYLVSPTGPNPNNLNSAYYQGFNLENRYINFAVNLGREGEGKAAFLANYGGLNLSDATRKAYAEIFGAAPTDAKVEALLSGGRDLYFEAYGQDGLNGQGTKAAMVGWLLAEAAKGDIGMYARANDAFLLDLADGAAFGVDLVGVYGASHYAHYDG